MIKCGMNLLIHSQTSTAQQSSLNSQPGDVCPKHYRKTPNISRTFIGNTIVDNSDVVGASPIGAALTTSSFST